MDVRNLHSHITDEMKREILSAMKEFTIHIDTSKGINNVYFRKHHLTVHTDSELWVSKPLFDNIRYVCKQLEVIFEGSNTESLCNKYKSKLDKLLM